MVYNTCSRTRIDACDAGVLAYYFEAVWIRGSLFSSCWSCLMAFVLSYREITGSSLNTPSVSLPKFLFTGGCKGTDVSDPVGDLQGVPQKWPRSVWSWIAYRFKEFSPCERTLCAGLSSVYTMSYDQGFQKAMWFSRSHDIRSSDHDHENPKSFFLTALGDIIYV